MTKSEAITEHLKHWDRFPVFVWQEGDYLVTEVDGQVVRARTAWQLDTKLDGVAPQPRNLYFVDEPDYSELPEASPETKGICNDERACSICYSGGKCA